ncbi:MAG: glutamate formiminotransferase [Actinobacteria bacterium]|nr:glutamate formiminotransferase [Actinomycetota bacterium]
MSRLIAVPNVSEGRDEAAISRYAEEISSAGASVLDVHADPTHNRSVYTVAGPTDALIEGTIRLAVACSKIDLSTHVGIHPRLGGLDVCPYVPHTGSMDEAIAAARAAGRSIYERAALPVYLYGEAALRADTRELPQLRRGGLGTLKQRANGGLAPDHGTTSEIDFRRGVVCVGARGVLIAFNVWLRCERRAAEEIAAAVRKGGGDRGAGLPGLRALGLAISPGVSQVSMNIVDPELTSIDQAFQAVALNAELRKIPIVHTELVGLVPERYQPDPNAAAARLLTEPGRSLEAALVGNA